MEHRLFLGFFSNRKLSTRRVFATQKQGKTPIDLQEKNSHVKQAGRKARQQKKGTVSTCTAAVTNSLLDRACNMHLWGGGGGCRTLNSAVYQFLWPFQLLAMTCCHFLSAAVRSALACHRRRATFHGFVPPVEGTLSHLSLSSSFFRSFMSRCTTFRTCSASSSVRADRSSLRPIAPGFATLGCWCGGVLGRMGTRVQGPGGARPLLIWGPGLGQP